MSQQLPAPKTFAPSREDILSNLAFFFGDPAVPEKLRDYSEHHAMYARLGRAGARAHAVSEPTLSRLPPRLRPPPPSLDAQDLPLPR